MRVKKRGGTWAWLQKKESVAGEVTGWAAQLRDASPAAPPAAPPGPQAPARAPRVVLDEASVSVAREELRQALLQPHGVERSP